MDERICLIYNYAQHYRLGVFKLLDKNLDIDFYFGDKMDDVKKLDYKELSGFKYELKNIKLFSNFYWQVGVINLLFNKSYGKYILLGEYYCLSTWLFLIFSLFSRKRIYLWSHGWYGKENKLIKIIKKIFFSMADGIFLYGEYAKKLMIMEGFNPEKLHVIYNSLDYEGQLTIRKGLNRSEVYKEYFRNDDPVLFFIGRLTKVKKIEMVIDALMLLKHKGRGFNLAIIGDGDQMMALGEKVRNLELKDRVWFIGALYDEIEIANYIFNADICVSPGNIGLTAMHVLTYGTPVITHKDFPYQMPEFEAIEYGETGLFFERDNLGDLCAKIEEWFEIGHNRQLLREKCYQIIDARFNPNYQYDVISSVLKIN